MGKNTNKPSLRDSQRESKQSKKNRHTERDKREVSKPRESKRQGESRAKKRIDESDSTLKHCDSYNLDSSVLDSSLRATRYAQNDGVAWIASAFSKPRNDDLGATRFAFAQFSQ